jgi:hypothetical protein
MEDRLHSFWRASHAAFLAFACTARMPRVTRNVLLHFPLPDLLPWRRLPHYSFWAQAAFNGYLQFSHWRYSYSL